MEKFSDEKLTEPGALVMLKSGGPAMTVMGIFERQDGVTFFDVEWFVERELREDTFRSTSLVVIDEAAVEYVNRQAA